MKADMSEAVSIPQGVTATYANEVITIKGPKGEVSRKFSSRKIVPSVKDSEFVFECKNATRRESKLIKTHISHVNNMIRGVQEPWVYELLVCSSHFPMNVKLDGTTLKVKNFLGEKTERRCKIPADVKVKVNGANITVESADIEKAGNTASAIELSTRISNRDLRIFQDGVYITKKAKQ